MIKYIYLTITAATLVFDQFSHPLRIFSNANASTEVITVQAKWPENAKIRRKIEYILATKEDYQYFNVDPSKGLISTRRTIDRRIGDEYHVRHLVIIS